MKRPPSKDINACLAYIDSYWDKIIHRPARKKVNRHSIDIPHPYFVPNHKKFNFIFYWDSFFMFRGLMGTGRETILKDMVDNFIYLYERYHIIPNFNAPASMGRSQPPFLSSMILDAYAMFERTKTIGRKARKFLVQAVYQKDPDKVWLKSAMDAAKREYYNVWLDPQNLYHHQVEGYGLQRYGDRDLGYAHSSELESGWDFTSRFYNRCSEFLPIDLNTYLYTYKINFAKTGEILDIPQQKEYWMEKKEARKDAINKYMWNEKEGFFFDYNYYYGRQSEFISLAGFTPLWAGLATQAQAQKMVKKLSSFETPFGLTITAKESLAPKLNLSAIPLRYRPAVEAVLRPKQWDYPYIWPPLEYLTVIGLLRYGFTTEAARVMKNAIDTQANIFKRYSTLYERINGETGDRAKSFHYHLQPGFGWTNAIFYRYVQILKALKNKQNIYKRPKAKTPPFDLAILH